MRGVLFVAVLVCLVSCTAAGDGDADGDLFAGMPLDTAGVGAGSGGAAGSGAAHAGTGASSAGTTGMVIAGSDAAGSSAGVGFAGEGGAGAGGSGGVAGGSAGMGGAAGFSSAGVGGSGGSGDAGTGGTGGEAGTGEAGTGEAGTGSQEPQPLSCAYHGFIDEDGVGTGITAADRVPQCDCYSVTRWLCDFGNNQKRWKVSQFVDPEIASVPFWCDMTWNATSDNAACADARAANTEYCCGGDS